MKGTSVKRGRPSKQLTIDDFSDVVTEALKGSHDAEPKKLATPQHVPTVTTAYVNKIFHFKNGSICAVNYGGCKDKPIDIHFKT